MPEIYEIVLPYGLETYALKIYLFSNFQFGIQEGVDCTEVSFTVLETIITCLKEVPKSLVVSLMQRKPFTLSGLMVSCTNYFMNLILKGRMWLALKDL